MTYVEVPVLRAKSAEMRQNHYVPGFVVRNPSFNAGAIHPLHRPSMVKDIVGHFFSLWESLCNIVIHPLPKCTQRGPDNTQVKQRREKPRTGWMGGDLQS